LVSSDRIVIFVKMENRKYTIDDIYDDLQSQKLEISGAGYEKMGMGILITIVVTLLVIISVVIFQ
jgi:hypothetical protein